MAQFNALRVLEVRRETEQSVSVKFQVPEDLKEEYRFKAGQYITLKTVINGNEVRRDYSICASPESGELRVAVKEVKDGLFSKFANNSLNIGDTLDVSPPNGRFVFEADASKKRHIVCFVAGSGITPVLSIIKSLLYSERESVISVLYGNKSVADCMFYNELLQLQSKYIGRLNLSFVFSQEQPQDSLFGRIDTANVNYFLKNNAFKDAIDTYYLCGPEEMIYSISDLLKSKGVDAENIKFELFTIKLESEPEAESVVEGKTEVTVMLDDEESKFIMDAKSSVLEAALAEDIDAPYSCQGGICSSCLARLKEGEVTMRQNNILTDDEVAEGLILTCQSHPTTPKIVVDYDDI